MNHQTTIPLHFPQIVHLRDGDQVLNIQARTIQSHSEFETFSLDHAFHTADDIAKFYNDLTDAIGPKLGDEMFIFLMYNDN